MNAGMLYTCEGKGGTYKILNISIGAGTSRGQSLVIYVCLDSATVFHRTVEDFQARMIKL